MLLRLLADLFSTVNSQLLMASGGDTKLRYSWYVWCELSHPWIIPVPDPSRWFAPCPDSDYLDWRPDSLVISSCYSSQRRRDLDLFRINKKAMNTSSCKKTISVYSSCLQPPLLFWLFLDVNSRGHNEWFFFQAVKLWILLREFFIFRNYWRNKGLCDEGQQIFLYQWRAGPEN